MPRITGKTPVGIVGLDSDRGGPLLTPEQQRLLDALADQAAVAIERIQLIADVDRARLAAEADKLRSALLALISHLWLPRLLPTGSGIAPDVPGMSRLRYARSAG